MLPSFDAIGGSATGLGAVPVPVGVVEQVLEPFAIPASKQYVCVSCLRIFVAAKNSLSGVDGITLYMNVNFQRTA
jgi:hypothetical protein